MKCNNFYKLKYFNTYKQSILYNVNYLASPKALELIRDNNPKNAIVKLYAIFKVNEDIKQNIENALNAFLLSNCENKVLFLKRLMCSWGISQEKITNTNLTYQCILTGKYSPSLICYTFNSYEDPNLFDNNPEEEEQKQGHVYTYYCSPDYSTTVIAAFYYLYNFHECILNGYNNQEDIFYYYMDILKSIASLNVQYITTTYL